MAALSVCVARKIQEVVLEVECSWLFLGRHKVKPIYTILLSLINSSRFFTLDSVLKEPTAISVTHSFKN